MAIKLPKEKTNQFIEVTDPKKGIGLWLHHLTRNVGFLHGRCKEHGNEGQYDQVGGHRP